MVTYNPVKNKVCALLKDQAKSEDILKAAFHVSDFELLHRFRCCQINLLESIFTESCASSLHSIIS